MLDVEVGCRGWTQIEVGRRGWTQRLDTEVIHCIQPLRPTSVSNLCVQPLCPTSASNL